MKRHLRQYGLVGVILGITGLLASLGLYGLIYGIVKDTRFDPAEVLVVLPVLIFTALVIAVRRQIQYGTKEWEGRRSWLYLVAFSLAGPGLAIAILAASWFALVEPVDRSYLIADFLPWLLPFWVLAAVSFFLASRVK